MKHLITLLSAFLISLSLFAFNEGTHLKIEIENYEGTEILLVNYLGDKAYIKDTLRSVDTGQFVYQNEEKLKSGLYYLVIPPNNEFIEILITEAEQQYSIQMDHTRLTTDVEFKNAPENSLLQDYRIFIQEKTITRSEIIKQQQEDSINLEVKEQLDQKLEDLQIEVKQYQEEAIKQQPKSLASTVVKTQLAPDYPDFEGTEEEQQQQYFWYTKTNFFAPFEQDSRLFTSNLFFQKVEQYIKEYTFVQPDSISQSLDKILELVESDEQAFRFYYLKFLNNYLQSKLIGMDAVVVHLVNRYMKNGQADFIGEDKRKELIAKVNRWETILIGKTAPDFRSFHLDIEQTLLRKEAKAPDQPFKVKEPLDLYQLKSPFTLLVFWSPTCGHCKESIPKLVEFYEAYKDKGLEVVAICDKESNEYSDCAQAIKDWKATQWINTVDPTSLYRFLFYVDETPKMFLLDHKKEILLKGNLKVESLGEIMDLFIEKREQGQE